jgi:hypothetical protein
MKVKFYVDSGANIHSIKKSKWLDTKKHLMLDDGEWEMFSDDKKQSFAQEWADNYLSIGYEEEEEKND